MKTIIVGLGNPVLGDDGVGWRVIEEVQRVYPHRGSINDPIDFDYLSLGGLSLMEHLIGYDRAILVDSINLEHTDTGTVRKFTLEELPYPPTGHLSSTHDTTLQKALQVGRSLGAHLPAEIIVISVQSPYVYDFSEELSPDISAAIPQAVQLVMAQIDHSTLPAIQINVENPL